ncbi:MAG: hypothetical protein WBA90_00280 [Albidovulum sp.]
MGADLLQAGRHEKPHRPDLKAARYTHFDLATQCQPGFRRRLGRTIDPTRRDQADNHKAKKRAHHGLTDTPTPATEVDRLGTTLTPEGVIRMPA